MVSTAASGSSPKLSVQGSHHPEQVQRMATTTKSYLWEALLGGFCLHVDFFLPSCLGWPLWCTAQVLFSTGLSMFCCAMSSFILPWFSSFLKFCICNFACSAALQICMVFSKFKSQWFLANAHVSSHYFRSPLRMWSHEWQRTKLSCFFKKIKLSFLQTTQAVSSID